MGRAPCCDKANVKRGPWSPEEDATLKRYLETHGTAGNWIALPQKAGLKRCGKSCRLRWLNYLRPDIKHGGYTEEEDKIILAFYGQMGSRWSLIASHLPGRTDNDVKNYWNTKLKKKLLAPKTAPENKNTLSPSHSTDPRVQKPETNSLAYWDSSAQNSVTVPILADHGNGYDPIVNCAQNLSLEDPVHFSMSGILEMSDQLGTASLMNSHIVSPSQEGSSSISDSASMVMASTSSCLEDNSAVNGMLMDSGFSFPYDPINFHYYQNLSGFGHAVAPADHDIMSRRQNQSIASYHII